MLLLAISEEQTHAIFDSLEHLRGFLLVVIILLLLWGMTALIGKTFMALEARKVAKAKAAVASAPFSVPTASQSPSAAPAATAPGAPTDEEVAAIAAAIAMCMQGGARIVSIRPASTDWGREGRRQIFASHKIR
ncbi:MAG: hypothetical protein JJT96_18775 [Opitutales bacterium]|nr:hypothetical protein [Opitutales bacterium]